MRPRPKGVKKVEIAQAVGYHQIVELLYRDPPYERATDKLAIHILELDKYRETDKDSTATPLRCWLTAICRSQDEKKPLTEVVKMDEELQEFYDIDPGFAQFVERHEAVAAMPEIRKAYRRREYDQMLDRLDEERRAAQLEAQLSESMAVGEAVGESRGVAIGEARGVVIGEARGEDRIKQIVILFMQDKSPSEISDELCISLEKVTDTLQELGLLE